MISQCSFKLTMSDSGASKDWRTSGDQDMDDHSHGPQPARDRPSGRLSCTTPSLQDLQAQLARRATMTRNWAGITLSRPDMSSSVQCRLQSQPPTKLSISASPRFLLGCQGAHHNVRCAACSVGANVSVVFSADGRNGDVQVVNRQLELIRIALFRPASRGLQLGDPPAVANPRPAE